MEESEKMSPTFVWILSRMVPISILRFPLITIFLTRTASLSDALQPLSGKARDMERTQTIRAKTRIKGLRSFNGLPYIVNCCVQKSWGPWIRHWLSQTFHNPLSGKNPMHYSTGISIIPTSDQTRNRSPFRIITLSAIRKLSRTGGPDSPQVPRTRRRTGAPRAPRQRFHLDRTVCSLYSFCPCRGSSVGRAEA